MVEAWRYTYYYWLLQKWRKSIIRICWVYKERGILYSWHENILSGMVANIISVIIFGFSITLEIISCYNSFTWHASCILNHAQMLENAGFDDVVAEDRTHDNAFRLLFWQIIFYCPYGVLTKLLRDYLCVPVHENTTTGVKCPSQQEGWFHWWLLGGGTFCIFLTYYVIIPFLYIRLYNNNNNALYIRLYFN